MNKNLLDLFIDKLYSFPLWVKQIIYVKLRDNLALSLTEDFILSNKDDVFHLYLPELTYLGKTELQERVSGFDNNFYNFLDGINKGFSIVEITLNNFWTLEECAKFFVLAMEQNFIKVPSSKVLKSMAYFMAGKYRTGEYFRHVDKIDIDKLSEIINKQKASAEAGKPVKMAELMISLGYITENDCKSLLLLKEEAQRRFILDTNLIPTTPNMQEITSEKEENYKQQIAKLQEQNITLIEQQKKLLAYFKKNQAQNEQV